jgi:hypothetical protein
MKRLIDFLLPMPAGNTLPGSRIPLYGFILLAVISAARSCIHMFAADGGAGSIAGMNLSLAGAEGIIFAFALWGSAQFVYALIQLGVAFRYRSLIPMMYVLLIVEGLLRSLVGRLHPVTFSHTPPGAYFNYLIAPIALAMLALSYWTANRRAPAREGSR